MKANAFKVRLYHMEDNKLCIETNSIRKFSSFSGFCCIIGKVKVRMLYIYDRLFSDFISSLEFLSLRVLAGFCWRQREASHTLTLQRLESRFFVYFTIAAQQWGKCTNKGIRKSFCSFMNYLIIWFLYLFDFCPTPSFLPGFINYYYSTCK